MNVNYMNLSVNETSLHAKVISTPLGWYTPLERNNGAYTKWNISSSWRKGNQTTQFT